MAVRKRYSVEQIIAKLREAEKLQGQALPFHKPATEPERSLAWRQTFGSTFAHLSQSDLISGDLRRRNDAGSRPA